MNELQGRDAEEYADSHLHEEETAPDRTEQRYSCPDTGKEWLLDFPERSERELGQARLRAVTV